MRTLPSLRTWLVLGLALTPATAFAQAAPPCRPRRHRVRRDEPADRTRAARHRERELERLRPVHVHLELEAALLAPYTNLNGSPNPLSPKRERSFTGTFTLFLGVHLWPGGEADFVPEVVALHRSPTCAASAARSRTSSSSGVGPRRRSSIGRGPTVADLRVRWRASGEALRPDPARHDGGQPAPGAHRRKPPRSWICSIAME